MKSLLKECAIDFVEAAAAAGQTTLTTDVMDMQGFENVMFIALTGDVTDTSVLTLTAFAHTANAAAGAAISGAVATFTADATSADNKMLIVDVVNPGKRYVYATFARGTANAVLSGIICIRYNGSKIPVSQAAGLIASALARG